jgi:hypothetical protein
MIPGIAHSLHPYPELVHCILRPFGTLFVRPEIVPRMSTAIVDQEPPPVIIGERLAGGGKNVEGRVHECRMIMIRDT